MSTTRLREGLSLPGDLVKSFVHGEFCRHQAWVRTAAQFFHYRTTTGVEVDFVIQDRRGELVGIEVKAAATVVGKDFNGLRHLRETTPRQFRTGIVLYTGRQIVPFDQQLFAVPLSLFWAR